MSPRVRAHLVGATSTVAAGQGLIGAGLAVAGHGSAGVWLGISALGTGAVAAAVFARKDPLPARPTSRGRHHLPREHP